MSTSLWMLVACGPAPEVVDDPDPIVDACEGPVVQNGEGFFERPFPHDDRLVEGRASYADFPQRAVTLVDDVATVAERATGWSPYGTMYVPFDGPLDVAGLPDLTGSLEPGSAVRLVPTEGGPPVPVHVRVFDRATSLLPANTLAVRPAWGRGLLPGVRYELQLSADVGCTSADAPGVVVPITAASPNDLLHDMVQVAREQLPMGGVFGADWLEQPAFYPGTREFAGRIAVPRWQDGTVPHATEGGDIRVDADGRPVIDGFDDVRVALVHPDSPPPAEGWPVVVVLDGTGSSFASTFFYGGLLAQQGIAAVGIDLPLHGERGVGPEFEAVVNLGNPLASVMNLLQGAADQVWLVDLLAREGGVAAGVPIDPDRLGYFGHSQGGIHGGLAVGHFDGKVKVAMLSGTGGGTFQGALFNQSSVNVTSIVSLIFGFEDGEVLDDFHPLATLIQQAADPADPIHTARFWFAEPGLQDHPLPAVFVTLGESDTFTPPLTTQAMAHAASIPIASGSFRIPADGLFPPPVDTLPIRASNAVGFDGTPVTAALVQYDGGHFVGLEDVDRWRTLFVSALVEDQVRIP